VRKEMHICKDLIEAVAHSEDANGPQLKSLFPLRIACMATVKSGILPRTKTISDESEPVAYLERRLHFSVIQEPLFIRMLRIERRRSERSGRRFMLALIDAEHFHRQSRATLFQSVSEEIAVSTRETDVLGWYKQDMTLGLLLTEIGNADDATIDLLTEKISAAVRRAVGMETFDRLKLVFRVFPQAISDEASDDADDADSILYPDLSGRFRKNRTGLIAKRVLDIVGSLCALILFAPVFLILAILVKATSAGPIFFSQKRLGQYGKDFPFLKFRTMYANNDPKIHQEYVAKLIAGNCEGGQGNVAYKMANDPRITSVGRILRKSSLDELPQLINVLIGQMSLVGPRPPLPYEYERYQPWHRRRVMELKPGMTGLWQVEGRSRTTFDEMVRMDIRYARKRSLWLDLKILLQTPRAVISGRGAC
jgi:lipopolysaccharide/colanic/teichoic acid biosynthesis glycosyltransferase